MGSKFTNQFEMNLKSDRFKENFYALNQKNNRRGLKDQDLTSHHVIKEKSKIWI